MQDEPIPPERLPGFQRSEASHPEERRKKAQCHQGTRASSKTLLQQQAKDDSPAASKHVRAPILQVHSKVSHQEAVETNRRQTDQGLSGKLIRGDAELRETKAGVASFRSRGGQIDIQRQRKSARQIKHSVCGKA